MSTQPGVDEDELNRDLPPQPFGNNLRERFPHTKTGLVVRTGEGENRQCTVSFGTPEQSETDSLRYPVVVNSGGRAYGNNRGESLNTNTGRATTCYIDQNGDKHCTAYGADLADPNMTGSLTVHSTVNSMGGSDRNPKGVSLVNQQQWPDYDNDGFPITTSRPKQEGDNPSGGGENVTGDLPNTTRYTHTQKETLDALPGSGDRFSCDWLFPVCRDMDCTLVQMPDQYDTNEFFSYQKDQDFGEDSQAFPDPGRLFMPDVVTRMGEKLNLDKRRGGGMKRELVGRNGGGRQLIFPGTGKATLYKGNRWFPRLYGNQWWLGRHQWFRPYYERYAPLWYPAYWTPLYVYDERNAYVRNPELSTMSVVPSMALPCFEADLGVLRYDRQSLSRDEEARVESTLNGINQQLELFKLEMQFNPSYVYWTKRGFVVVPDLDRGCFVWAYTRQQGGMMGMSASSPSLDLDANKGKQTHKHSHQHEHTGVDLQKEVATLANEKILFDVYSEKTPYTGHFISQDGDVYAYTIDSQGKGKTTFVDRLFDVTVPLNEIERLKDMLRAAAKAKVDHFRHDSGDRKYWGFLGNERMFIRGDDNSHSAEADALVNEIDRILFKKKSLYPPAY